MKSLKHFGVEPLITVGTAMTHAHTKISLQKNNNNQNKISLISNIYYTIQFFFNMAQFIKNNKRKTNIDKSCQSLQNNLGDSILPNEVPIL